MIRRTSAETRSGDTNPPAEPEQEQTEMADEGTQEPVADQTAVDETPLEQVPPPETTPATETAPEPVTEVPETPPVEQTPAQKAVWDKEEQKRHQEKANSEKARQAKELAELRETVAALVSGLKTAVPATPKPVQVDELAEVQKLKAQAKALREQAKAEKEKDIYVALDLATQAADMEASASDLRDKIAERQESWRKAKEFQDAESQTQSLYSRNFAKQNADIPVDSARELADECYRTAAESGYEGKSLELRANEMFKEKLPTLKKTPSAPAPKSSAKPTAPVAAASSPSAKQVVPGNTGVRKALVSAAELKEKFARHWRQAN